MNKKKFLVIMSIFALLLSNMAVYAADDSVNTGYGTTETEESNDYEEEIITLKEAFAESGEFIEFGDLYSINTLDSMGQTLKAGKAGVSSGFKPTGATITVASVGTPVDKDYSVGILQPNGVIRRVTGTGSIVHTFDVTQSGTHKIYIANRSSVEMTIVVSYRY